VARPFLSLLLAVGATVAGLSLTAHGAAAHSATTREPGGFDLPGLALSSAGLLLVGLAAFSLAIHWVGALVAGSVHALLGFLALVSPFGNPFGGGIFSPVFQITRMLSAVDARIGEAATVFYFSGTAIVIGAFLAGAALGIRSRRLTGASSSKAVLVSSFLGAGLLLGATMLLLVAGGTFARLIMQAMRYDASLAVFGVIAGLLAGLAGILLRWSSVGVFLAAVIVIVVGEAAFLAAPDVPSWFPGALLAQQGLLLVVGVTALGAAIGGTVRDRSPVPADAVDL
jgi:hypothetical protein